LEESPDAVLVWEAKPPEVCTLPGPSYSTSPVGVSAPVIGSTAGLPGRVMRMVSVIRLSAARLSLGRLAAIMLAGSMPASCQA